MLDDEWPYNKVRIQIEGLNMTTAVLTSKGQITIPKEVARELVSLQV